LEVNGREVGETELNAGIAGHHGVPLIFVAGDKATTQEAKDIHPRIVTVAVKEAIGRTAAACLHPEEARELIGEGVKQALKDLKKIPPYKVAEPVTFTITFTDAKRADAAALIPTAKRISGKIIQITTDDYITGYHGFIAAVLCGTAVSR
jgi:D-amino peptidase